jgi:hypothetical protein
MGAYAQLLVDGYSFCETKNHVDPTVMTLFRESDRRCVERTYAEVYGEEPQEGNPTVVCFGYANTARNIRQRLDVMGFSLAGVERDFRAVMGDEFERFADEAKDGQFSQSHLEEQIYLLSLSLEAYIHAFEEIRKRNLHAYCCTDSPPLRIVHL